MVKTAPSARRQGGANSNGEGEASLRPGQPTLAAKGNRRAAAGKAGVRFEQIVADYGPLISRIAMSYEADPGLRQDLVQQVFLAIWQALPGFRGESSIKTFVAKIAQNRSISHVVKRVREPPVAPLDELAAVDRSTPEDNVNSSRERQLLLRATQDLPMPQRQVIVLVLEGFSYAEIAEMLEIPANALALRLTRAKTALKSILERNQ
jgi:RNA polymerase sigma factor (sigma-70 family)